jgi:hypothetical protein
MTFLGYRGQAPRTEAVYHTPTSNFNLTVAVEEGRFVTLFLRFIIREFLNRKSLSVELPV